MGWQFDKKGDKFRIWSTVVDEYLTDWLDRKEVLAYIYQEKLESFKKSVIELYMTFPDKRGTMEGRKIYIDKDHRVRYSIWTIELFNLEDEDYDQELERMFSEALEFMGVKATPCPQDFKDFLKTCAVLDLAKLFNDLKKHPQDVEYMKAVSDEMKLR